MKSDDTEPGAPALGGDATDPGSPPGHVEETPRGDRDVAASLLRDLAGAPLPVDGVRDTHGHSAAAFTLGAHKPPRRHATPTPTPAVVLSTTQPMAAAHVPDDAPDQEAGLRRERPNRSATTVPRANARPRRPGGASGVLAAVAAFVAVVGIVTWAVRPHASTAPDVTSPAAPSFTASAVAPASPVAPATAAPSAPSEASAAPTVSASAATTPAVASPRTSARPAGSASPLPSASPSPPSSSRPSPTPHVVEPERTF